MIEFTETLYDTLFSDFINSVKTVGESYVDDCLQLREMDPEGINVSQVNGWHSQRFDSRFDLNGCGVERLDKLMDGCWSYTNQFIREKFSMHSSIEDNREWWVNIGGNMSYNNIHVHGRAKVIGIYFVKVPEGSGDLMLQRNDGSAYSGLYHDEQIFSVTPEENRFYILPGHLWHWVNMHQGVEDRISISVNYY